VFRIVTVEGPQVGDLNIWNAHNPRERLWASRTRQAPAAHVTTLRPPVVDLAVPAPDRDDNGGQSQGLTASTSSAAASTTCSAPAAILRQPHADRPGFRPPLPLQPGPRRGAARADRVRRARVPERLSSAPASIMPTNISMRASPAKQATTSSSSPRSISCAPSRPVPAATSRWPCGPDAQRPAHGSAAHSASRSMPLDPKLSRRLEVAAEPSVQGRARR